MLPNTFLDTIKSQIPTEVADFQLALAEIAPTSIRWNNLKSQTPNEHAKKIKWHPHGEYLKERPIFTLDPAFHAGAYYVQEASSMFVAEALKQTVVLDNKLTVLDLCAAPGGKSTLLSALLSEQSLILSNEVIQSRYRILQENIRKWGAPNIATTNLDPTDFAPLTNFFDVILIDAPCSGEGLFRKDKKAIIEWSPNNVQLCSARQKRIFKEALPLLKAGGILIYCTCTYNDLENIQNVSWLCEHFPLQSLPLDIPADWGIVEKKKSKEFGYQFYPHKVKGEGFFISIFKKKFPTNTVSSGFIKKRKKDKNQFRSLTPLGNKKKVQLKSWIAQPNDFAFFETPTATILALPKAQLPSFLQLDKVLKKKHFGIPVGSFKRDDFIPSHELAMSTIIQQDLPAIEVAKQEALLFLKKEKMNISPNQKGWHLIRYQGLNLGWVKVVPGRINNYLPKSLRIRMDIG